MVVDLRKKQIAKIIAKSWVDDDFRVALIADPVGVITGFGVRLTEGMTLEILQDTDQLVFIVLPAPPWVIPTHLTMFPYLDDDANELQRTMGDIASRSWIDDAFKSRLKSNPRQCLAEEGAKPDADTAMELRENTANRMYLSLPVKPDLSDLSETEIEALAESKVMGVSSEKLY